MHILQPSKPKGERKVWPPLRAHPWANRPLYDPEAGKVFVNCLTAQLVEKALGLDGEQLVTPGGRAVGTLTVHRVRSLPMGQKEIMEAVDTLMWAGSEGQRVAPKMEGTTQAPRQETNPWPNVPWQNAQWPNAPVRTVQNRPPPGVFRSPPKNPD